MQALITGRDFVCRLPPAVCTGTPLLSHNEARLGPSIVFHGEAGLVKARTDPNKTTKPYAAVDVGIGQAEAHAKFSPAGFDVGAGVSLAGGSVSVFVSTSISAPASARPPVLTTTRSR